MGGLNCSVSKYSGTILAGGAYWGATYHTLTQHVVFTPFGEADTMEYHSIDCLSGGLLKTTPHNISGQLPVNAAYVGDGAYHKVLHRIYWAPYQQAPQSTWHYVASDGRVLSYDHGAPLQPAQAYSGAYYCEDDVFFVPSGAAVENSWVLINSTGGAETYTAGVGAVLFAYSGGAVCPQQQRLVFAPGAQSAENQWHTVNCDSRTVASYAHGQGTLSSNAYSDAVFHASTNRVYFVPRGQSDDPTWHFYACASGQVSGYLNGGAGIADGYTGGALVDGTDVIFAPYVRASFATYQKVDSAGLIVSYPNDFSGGITSNSYRSGAVCNVKGVDRLYLAPFTTTSDWHFISCTIPNATIAPSSSPTRIPTLVPSSSPTDVPTSTPSSSPTIIPTRIPSLLPSSSPTKTPTRIPSLSPSSSPTNTPTRIPSLSPSSSPTNTPTLLPSSSPTKTPTRIPSLSPSSSPTNTPTRIPSLLPSSAPTNVLTSNPTLVTGASPSVGPTQASTIVPTQLPSSAPSSSPTVTLPAVISSGTVINGAVIVSSLIDLSGGSLVIGGSLTFTPSAQWTVGVAAAVNVSGAAVLGGALLIQAGAKPTTAGPVVVPIVNAGSLSGTFLSVDAVFDDLLPCEVVIASPQQSPSSFSVSLLVDASSCPSSRLSPGAIAGIAIGCVVAALLLVGLPILLKERRYKRKTREQLGKLDTAMKEM